MTWAAAIAASVAGTAMVVDYVSGKEASEEEEKANEKARTAEEEMFERSLGLQQPYREAGYEALSGLQSLSTSQGRADELESYYAGPEYSAMKFEAEQNSSRSLNATGRMRGGAGYKALESIAPQLGQQHLDNQYNNLTGLANMGIGAASQGASGANALGSNLANRYVQQGEIGAYRSMANANSFNQAAGTLGGIAGDYYANRNTSTASSTPPPEQQYTDWRP